MKKRQHKTAEMISDTSASNYPPVLATRAPMVIPELGLSLYKPSPQNMLTALQKGYELKVFREGQGSLLGSLTKAAGRLGLTLWSCEAKEKAESGKSARIWLIRLRKPGEEVSPFALMERGLHERPARGFYRALVRRVIKEGSVEMHQWEQVLSLKRELRVFLRKGKLVPISARNVVRVDRVALALDPVRKETWRVSIKEEFRENVKEAKPH